MSSLDTLGGPEGTVIARALTRSAAIAVVGLALYAVAPVRGFLGWVTFTVAAASICVIAPFTLSRARRLLSSDRPLLDGAIAITGLMMVLILGFSAMYLVLAQRPDEVEGLETRIDALYFTVMTLATVGPGDIHAKGQGARLVATGQVLIDVVVLAVSVRILTGVATRRRREADRAEIDQGDDGADAT